MGKRLFGLACLGILLAAAQCRSQPTEVRLCHAEILSPLLQQAAQVFERNHLAARVRLLPSSDLEVAGRALRQDCDLAAVTDWRLIRRFLLSGPDSEGFRFLGDEVVLALRTGFFASQQQREGWSAGWPQRLLADGVRFGLADPRQQAIGYHTHLVWKLSEAYFGRPGFYRSMLRRVEGLPSELVTGPALLVDQLKGGTLDLAFLYRSTALYNGLEQIRLPSEVSLGEAGLQHLYARVFFSVAGPSPWGRFEVGGAPVRHGICLLNRSNQWAGRLLDFLLGPETGEIARGQGYTIIPVERFSALNRQ
ncbi:MAG: substrate-binding domain-containing protein [Acidobacteriota bacterium]